MRHHAEPVRKILERIEHKLKLISDALRLNLQLEVIELATLDETLTKVTEESTVDDSIIALLTAIKAQLDAGGLNADAQAKVDAIFAGLQANITKVTEAVTANTPAAPPPTP